jgi:hypothetical protein
MKGSHPSLPSLPTAREIITAFDVDYDIPLAHDPALGVLQIHGAFHPPVMDMGDPVRRMACATFIGAVWCKIVAADVQYRILDGLEAIEDSKAHAEALSQWILGRGQHEFATDADGGELQFMAYVTARWLDASGKVLYRAGNHTEGRMSFERSHEVCSLANLWWCKPDIESNLLRGRFEEQRNIDPAAASGVIANIDLAIKVARGHVIPNCPCPSMQDRRNREFRRGLASLLHNHATVVYATEPNLAWNHSKASEAICADQGDEYRVAQAILFRALKHRCPARQLGLYGRLESMRWRRGQLIAKQQKPKLKGLLPLSERVRLLTAIFDAISADAATRNGQSSMDLDFHAFTVKALGDVLLEPEARSAPEFQGWEALHEAQREWMLRQLRKVVLISDYKRKFSTWVWPIYQQRIARALSTGTEEGFQRALADVEESSGREIMDLIAGLEGNVGPAKPPTRTQDHVHSAPNQQEQTPETQADGTHPRRGAVREPDKDQLGVILRVLGEERKETEGELMRRPMASIGADPDIYHRTRMFVANQDDECIVRFFAYAGPEKQGAGQQAGAGGLLGAFVFRGKRVGLVQNIALEQVRDLARRLKPSKTKPCPSAQDCMDLWNLVIDPLVPEIRDDSAEGDELRWPKRLVLVPCDDLFAMPLHVAMRPSDAVPLAALVPLCLSVSLTAYIRGRHLYRRQVIEQDDDLCALIVPEPGISGDEIAGVPWPQEQIHVAGRLPSGLQGQPRRVSIGAQIDDLARLTECEPEYMVIAAHGYFSDAMKDFGPVLQLNSATNTAPEYLSQYRWIRDKQRLRLPHNKLTLLNACVIGHGANVGGGEVAGFVRAMMAVGAGAIGLTLWSVRDQYIAAASQSLLNAANPACGHNKFFDCMDVLFHTCRKACAQETVPDMRIEACPIGLYL